MKGRKILSVASACAMALMVLAPSVAAEESKVTNSETPVSYDFRTSVDPVNPGYEVDIPVGVVFDANNPTKYIEAYVVMTPAQGTKDIVAGSSAKVSVKSKNGYIVKLENGDDKIAYYLKYGNIEINSGTGVTELGSISKESTTLKGYARLDGVATRTGNHIDTLTYTITDTTSGA